MLVGVSVVWNLKMVYLAMRFLVAYFAVRESLNS